MSDAWWNEIKTPRSVWFQFRERPTNRVFGLIIQQNMGLVDKVANQQMQRCRTPFEDLRQVGTIGLVRAVQAFDVTTGYEFSSYAIPKIRGEILHYQRDNRGLAKVPRAWQEYFDRVRRTQREWRACGRDCSLDEVAIALGKSLQEWRIIEEALRYLPHTEISELQSDPADESFSGPSVEIPDALARLPWKVQQAVTRSIVQNQAVELIAVDLGMTVADTRICIQNGLEQLRHHLENSVYALR